MGAPRRVLVLVVRKPLFRHRSSVGLPPFHWKLPEYHTWSSMIQRCGNSNNPAYKQYGARGIKVCKRWKKFRNFLLDMGKRPSPRHSLDRFPNNDGDYEPNNCRWATDREQSFNTSRNVAPEDITGMRFGILTAIRDTGKRSYKSALWKFRCDCGTLKILERNGVVSGHTRSCGPKHWKEVHAISLSSVHL